MNPFDILGVAPGSDPSVIRDAYRRLARSLHPDIDPTPGAAQRFMALKSAYEEALAASSAPAANSPAAGTARRHRKVTRELVISVADIVLGARKSIAATSGLCRGCQGTGRIPVDYATYCASCGGSGISSTKSRGYSRVQVQCYECEGTGETAALECHLCGGFGLEDAQSCVVEVPRGSVDGDVLVVPGAAGLRSESVSGDLDIVLRVRDPLFAVEGSDIATTVHVDIWTASLGGVADVRHPSGASLRLKVPPGSASGRKFKLVGKGIPARQPQGSAGDFVVTMLIRPVPVDDTAVKVALLELRRLVSENKTPPDGGASGGV